jgi:hypothetical protein
MQATERENEIEGVPQTDPQSQPLTPVSLVTVDETDDDPEEIFLNAIAEIDTQPLVKKRKPLVMNFIDVLQVFFCSSLILVSFAGIIWQCITYPHTLVILYTVEKPANLTTTLDVPTRTLAPVTLTRSLSTPTTGHGHQDARVARGTLIFYNGSSTPQYVPIGSVFTGSDGVKVATEQSTTVPAANLPAIGSMPVLAHALLPGSHGNIAAFDVDMALSPVLKVRNEALFTNGREARDYKAVAQQDVSNVTSTVQKTLATAFTTAFPLRPGEQAQPTNCHTTTTANHTVGDEAQTVTLNDSETCSALAYNSQHLTSQATAAFTQTQPAANYHIVGNIQTALQSVTPLFVTISGKWGYTFSPDYEQLLAEKIAGDTPARARKYLLSTGVIVQASVPNTLPPAMYINFLVLIGE